MAVVVRENDDRFSFVLIHLEAELFLDIIDFFICKFST